MNAMISIAAIGNLPIIAGIDIVKATTISETITMGLAPVFLLHQWADRSPWRFPLSFWGGISIGLAFAAERVPNGHTIGDGTYALLLGANAHGLVICTIGFLLPLALRRAAAIAPRAGQADR